MPKYIVPINFWGTIEADSAEEAFDKIYAEVDCESFEKELKLAGLTDIDHLHEEVEESED